MIELSELAVLLNRHYRIVIVLRGQFHLLYLLRESALIFKAAQRPRYRIFKALVQFPLTEEKLCVLFLGKSLLKFEFPLSAQQVTLAYIQLLLMLKMVYLGL